MAGSSIALGNTPVAERISKGLHRQGSPLRLKEGKDGDVVDTKFWHVSRKSVAKEKGFCAVRSVDSDGRSCNTVKDLADRRGRS